MTQPSIAKFCVLAAGIATLPAAFAGTEMSYKESKPVVEMAKESCISGDLGINVVSQYVSRGLVFENQGAIIEPYADLYFKLYSSEGFLNEITLNLGIWNSFHSRHTDAGAVNGSGTSSTRSWYEFDFTAGLSFTFADKFTFTPSYFTFLSPNDGFSTFQGLNLKLAFDDSDMLGAFALNPYVQVLFELENKAGSGPDEGIYYEIGIAPSVPLGPVTLSFPINAGFGSDSFYQGSDLTYGFTAVGAAASYTIASIPECYGTWTASAGATYYHLSSDSGLKTFNVNNVRDEGHTEWVFSGGLSVAF